MPEIASFLEEIKKMDSQRRDTGHHDGKKLCIHGITR
jgi:hypothetical protein